MLKSNLMRPEACCCCSPLPTVSTFFFVMGLSAWLGQKVDMRTKYEKWNQEIIKSNAILHRTRLLFAKTANKLSPLH